MKLEGVHLIYPDRLSDELYLFLCDLGISHVFLKLTHVFGIVYKCPKSNWFCHDVPPMPLSYIYVTFAGIYRIRGLYLPPSSTKLSDLLTLYIHRRAYISFSVYVRFLSIMGYLLTSQNFRYLLLYFSALEATYEVCITRFL